MDVTGSIIFGGVANAVILAAVSALNWRKHAAAAWLCASLALMSLAAATILIQHRLDGAGERIAVTIEHIAAYAAAPTVYQFVKAALGMPTGGTRTWVHFVPAGVFLAVGAPLTAAGTSEPPPFELTIAYMMAYTGASLFVFAKTWARTSFEPSLAWPAAILAMMVAIHLGQLIRMTSDSPAVQDIVALIGAVAVFGLLLLGLAGFVPWAVASASRYAKSNASREDLTAVFHALKGKLEEDRLFLRPNLRLDDIAAAAGVSPQQASQALSQAGGVSFNELLADYRVAEARRLLAQPENASVSVEPIGMEAGFRSRSSFYEAFQKRLGHTPAQYRRRFLHENRVQPDRDGQDKSRRRPENL